MEEEQQNEEAFIEVLKSGDVCVADFLSLLASHAGDYARRVQSRNTTLEICDEVGKNRAEQDWTCPVGSFQNIGTRQTPTISRHSPFSAPPDQAASPAPSRVPRP
jgi:hypothetical protein